MVLYSIKDLKGNFGVPMAFQNDDMAIRAMPFMMQRDELMQRYPEDFELFSVGEFSEFSGFVVAFDAPVFLKSFGGVKDEKSV